MDSCCYECIVPEIMYIRVEILATAYLICCRLTSIEGLGINF